MLRFVSATWSQPDWVEAYSRSLWNVCSPSDVDSFWNFNSLFPIDRCFFASDNHLYGFGPRDTREGDCLAILAGGRVPYVLRKSPNAPASRPNLFSFVGECYVEGVMYGELLNMPRTRDFEDIELE